MSSQKSKNSPFFFLISLGFFEFAEPEIMLNCKIFVQIPKCTRFEIMQKMYNFSLSPTSPLEPAEAKKTTKIVKFQFPQTQTFFFKKRVRRAQNNCKIAKNSR